MERTGRERGERESDALHVDFDLLGNGEDSLDNGGLGDAVVGDGFEDTLASGL